MTLPKTSGSEWAAAQASPQVPVNGSMRRLDALANRAIIVDRDLTAAPGTCADGANYLVSGTPGGGDAWVGQGGKLATAVGTNAVNGWAFQTVAVEGYQLYVQDENLETQHNGSTWVDIVATGGKFTIPINASAMTSRTTNGAAAGSSESTTNKIMVVTFDFDQSTDEFVQFMLPMPKSWNESTVTARFYWTAAATGNVVWGIQAVAISDDDPVDAAFGTAVTVTDGVTAANDLMITAETGAVTIGGTPAEGDLVVFQVYRDADNGSDTVAADAKLLSLKLFITTNAADDS